jgi:hypothetical protein
MDQNEYLKSLVFTDEFSVEDWNSLLSLKLKKYFRTEALYEKNKEILRTELLNYIQFCEKENYFNLFTETIAEINLAISSNTNLAIEKLAYFFDDMSNTDMKWTANVMTQPDYPSLSERDKLFYIFTMIGEILEGCFKPRFRFLYEIVSFSNDLIFPNTSKMDFGQLISGFAESKVSIYQLYLMDPIFGIATSQWRNIAAHKTFKIEYNQIVVTYGKKNLKTETLQYVQLYELLEWVKQMYRVLRLSQVLVSLNYIKEIVDKLGGTDKIKIRFEGALLHLVHNLQIVGFEFIKSQEVGSTFSITLKKKLNDELKFSIIHASQCLDQLSCSLHDDEFTRNRFVTAKVIVVDIDNDCAASASVNIKTALDKTHNKMSQEEYISNIIWEKTAPNIGIAASGA